MDVQSVSELQENLTNYKEQLEQVNELLSADPENEEYKEMASGLKEVIELTEDLLNTARQNENPSAPSSTSSLQQTSEGQQVSSFGLPPVNFVASQSNSATAANTEGVSGGGKLADRLPVGTRVRAIWSEDGEWYDGVIDAITPGGYQVTYVGWGNAEEVEPANIRPVVEEHEEEQEQVEIEEEGEKDHDALAAAELEAEAARQAIKRKLVEAAHLELIPRDLPAKLRINPDDSEDVKSAKRKKIHSFKSKQRLEVMEVAQNQKQHAWQQFQTKGKQKKVGFFTGRKKESIFKSPEDIKGKVGVTGSGHGMTEFQRREKYVPAKGSGEEGDE